MLDILFQGGVVLIPIIALSVFGLAVIIERLVYFLKIKEPRSDLAGYTMGLLRKGYLDAAFRELRRKRSPEASVILAGLEANEVREALIEEVKTRMESQAVRTLSDVEKNVPYLASVANIATLLGLFGTVTGMIVSFLNLKISGAPDPAVLAGGISQALVTTAAGLGVAIPCLLFYHIYTQIANRLATRMEIAAAELSAFLSERERDGARDR